MRAVVTGASGFLGRHLTAALEPTMSVDAPVGDVRDADTYAKLAHADAVFHLAAKSSVPESVRDPAGTWDVNVGGTLRLLEWARATDAGRVVVVSSAHVYGPPRYSPIDEAHPRRPVSPYGASKLASEALAFSYAATYGLDMVVVRPFNVYGPGQAKGFLVPDILQQIADGKSLALGDPRPVRDFTYVEDAIAFLLAAGTAKGARGLALNLGSGEGHSVRQVVDAALRVTRSDLAPRFDDSRARAGDVRDLVVDNRRAREVLAWAPRVPLDDGLRRTWEAWKPT